MSPAQLVRHCANEAETVKANAVIVVIFTPEGGMLMRRNGCTPEMLALAGASLSFQAVVGTMPTPAEPITKL